MIRATTWGLASATTLVAAHALGQAGQGQGSTSPRFPELIRPVFVSGTVALEDGRPPPEPVLVKRVCDGRPLPLGFTDGRGRFSFELGRNASLSVDAQNDPAFPSGAYARDLTGCELRVDLAGFYPASVDLSGRRLLDSPDVGTLVLRRMPGVEGTVFSLTSRMAQKEARTAFEKGRALAAEKKLAESVKEYEKAVRIFPGFAAAWFELGLVHQMANHAADARRAYGEALAADPRFVRPYRQLAVLSFGEQKWEDVVEKTDRLVALDPVSYPDAYFYSAVANFYLNRLDAAERSAREAEKLDPDRRFAKTRYVLGAILIEKKDYPGAAEQLRQYLELAEPGPDADRAREMLAQLAARGQVLK